jgi:hypothetical protein
VPGTTYSRAEWERFLSFQWSSPLGSACLAEPVLRGQHCRLGPLEQTRDGVYVLHVITRQAEVPPELRAEALRRAIARAVQARLGLEVVVEIAAPAAR